MHNIVAAAIIALAILCATLWTAMTLRYDVYSSGDYLVSFDRWSRSVTLCRVVPVGTPPLVRCFSPYPLRP